MASEFVFFALRSQVGRAAFSSEMNILMRCAFSKSPHCCNGRARYMYSSYNSRNTLLRNICLALKVLLQRYHVGIFQETVLLCKEARAGSEISMAAWLQMTQTSFLGGHLLFFYEFLYNFLNVYNGINNKCSMSS